MIPNADQLLAISHMQGGDLGETPFAVLLHAMAVHERSGVLEIERGPLRKEIFIENGLPVDCRSNLLHETLSRFMVNQGHLTEEQGQEYLTKSTARGLQFGEALILDGVISASELYRHLQANLARKLLDGFTWRSGSFRVNGDPPPVESALKVKVPQLVVTGISKFASDEEVNSAVGPLVGKTLRLHPAPPYPREEIRLSKEQQKLVGLLQDGKRIDELAAETTIPFDQIMRLLYSMAVIGIVVPEDQLPADFEIPVPEVEEEPEPVRDDTMIIRLQKQQQFMPAEDVERLRDRVMEAYLRYRKQDAFDLLVLSEDAGLVALQDAFIEYSRRFAPWQYDGPGLKGVREKAQDLFLAGGQAFAELSDVDKRNALIMRRKLLREEKNKRPAADRFAIKSDLLDSELQFKKGKSLMAQAKYKDALKQLQFAFDMDPQNAIYRAELAYCQFLDRPQGEAPRARTELRETLRIDPKCGLAFYYLGMVEMHLENWDDAETLLQRAIKLMMPDRRPIEGLKDLQTRAKKRKKLGFL
ncbi:MAG: DUF4388 domain-containing protein [Acidobacteriota bacterium]